MKASRTPLALRVTLLVLGWSLGYPALSTPPATDVPSGFRLVGQSAAPAEGPVSGILRIDDQTLLTDAGDIYDLSEPTRPRRVATSAWHGAALEVQGSTGYLAAGRDGLVLLDLRDLRQPARLGGYRTSGDARALGRMASSRIACGLMGSFSTWPRARPVSRFLMSPIRPVRAGWAAISAADTPAASRSSAHGSTSRTATWEVSRSSTWLRPRNPAA